MTNATWVCFDCRRAVRSPSSRHALAHRPWLLGNHSRCSRCPDCRQPLRFLGPTIEVPRRNNVRAWRDLRAEVNRRVGEMRDSIPPLLVRHRHDLERRIADLAARPHTAGRDVLLKQLRAQLDEAKAATGLTAPPDLPDPVKRQLPRITSIPHPPTSPTSPTNPATR